MAERENYSEYITGGKVSTITPAVLTTAEAAAYVALGKNTLEKLRIVGDGPVFVKLGRSVRYRREDLDTWINDRVATSTS